ncbi:MAG TPA: hypothetical protein DCE41_32640 [Cytophagales bacterium]|nr:hypothetical protein [Cytophagales bacterium]HAA22855.1 hypothetical protein [Cytophagales bacterium]HAP64429.1 hypothetical protein [Cytophagales bacterium]
MIKLNFTYQGEPFRQGEVAESWRQHPAQLSNLLARLSKHESMAGELVVNYSEKGPRDFQIEALTGIAPQKLVRLFSKMGFRPFSS